MRQVLVTGARGFIGRHVVEALGRQAGMAVVALDRESTDDDLSRALRTADVVVHLAGANRPTDDSEFQRVNVDYTTRIAALLAERDRRIPVLFSSSTQATLDNVYGRSKLAAEAALRAYSEQTGAAVTVFRLTNVFGKWARPNYNSFVATLCHGVAQGAPYSVSDPSRVLELVYVDDVVAAIVRAVLEPEASGFRIADVGPVYAITLDNLVARVEGFRTQRETLVLPDLGDRLTVSLYATYLSYLAPADFAYQLTARHDARGSLAEFVKSPAMGQIFVSRTLPGVTRGNHYHHTKTEKFLVVEGEGVVRFRHIDSGSVIEHRASGRDYRVMDIPPGYTHSIENVGAGEMVTIFWASEIFDPQRPDTYALPVLDVPA